MDQLPGFSLRDIAEIVVGSVILAFPTAVTEEVWVIGTKLPVGRAFLIILGSLFFIGWFGYYMFYRTILRKKWSEFLLRIFSVYLITLITSALILAVIDKLELYSDPIIAFKRTILVAVPACFAATVVDSIRH